MTLTRKISIPLMAAAMAATAFLALQPAGADGFNEQVSGNFIDTAIDTNDDGSQANYFSGAAKGNGSPTYEGLVEIAFTAPTGLCDSGIVEGEVVEYSIVRRYKNGDLAFSRLMSGSVCFDIATGTADLTIEAAVTGGTGKFDGATGSYTANYTVQLLVPDPTGGIGHGAFHGTTSD